MSRSAANIAPATRSIFCASFGIVILALNFGVHRRAANGSRFNPVAAPVGEGNHRMISISPQFSRSAGEGGS
jgi:hypothetical protein